MSRSLVKSFRHDGFTLGSGVIFGTVASSTRIHTAIVGPSEHPIGSTYDPREKIGTALIDLFGILALKADVFRALRDTRLFWETAAAEWNIVGEMSCDDVQSLINVYVSGRKAFRRNKRRTTSGANKKSLLTDVVDAWISVHEQVCAMPPLPSMSLTIRPHETFLGSLSLGQSPAKWPPSFFNAQEYAWLSDKHVKWQLKENFEAGSFPFLPKPGEHDVPLVPTNICYPGDLKLWTGWCNLSRFEPDVSTWAIFMAPIAFKHAEDKKKWYLATGSLSKRHATVQEFFGYGLHMLQGSGNRLVLGISTHWFDRPESFVGGYWKHKRAFRSRHGYWADNCLRYGLGLALQKMPAGRNGYRLIIYDMDYPNLIMHNEKPDTGDPEMDETIVCMNDWRDVIAVAADNKMKDGLIEVWRGGKKPHLLSERYDIEIVERDSVSHSCH